MVFPAARSLGRVGNGSGAAPAPLTRSRSGSAGAQLGQRDEHHGGGMGRVQRTGTSAAYRHRSYSERENKHAIDKVYR